MKGIVKEVEVVWARVKLLARREVMRRIEAILKGCEYVLFLVLGCFYVA